MPSTIKSIEYHLPGTVITNNDLEKEFADWSASKIEKKTGIRERHVVKPNETSLNLALAAGEKLLAGYDRKRIDYLLLCTQSPDYFLPAGACLLQHKLGLRTDIGAFDFNQGCSGFIYGLSTAKGLIAGGIAGNVLLITAETYTKFINPKDRGNRTIFGDGAAATIIERSDNSGILNFVLGTDGSGFQNLIVPAGGMRIKFDHSAPEITDNNGNTRTDNDLFMNGPEIFNFTIESVPKLFSKTLEINKLSLEEIDYVIFHQANKYMIGYLKEKIGIPDNKFYMNMLTTGNTVSSTIPIALKNCIADGTVKPGNKILLCGFGVGYSWGATVIQL
jgi:3-oxoacyl-[acyl-carrier-protein] synthase III